MNIVRLRQIAQYQQETGCRVEYEAATVLALLDSLEKERSRKEFLRRWFTNESQWTDADIDRAIAARKAKGFD